MRGNKFEYEGGISLGDQEGGFAADSIDLEDSGWVTSGEVRTWVKAHDLGQMLAEKMGLYELVGYRNVVQARISIEILDTSKAEAEKAARAEGLKRWLDRHGLTEEKETVDGVEGSNLYWMGDK